MLAIYFFCAGHGDAIVLEWKDRGKKKFGVIDCNKNGELNPVKYFFNFINKPIIEFCILSHPHWDHYSGFLEFIQFCSEREILPEKFYHTAEFHKQVLYGSVSPPYKRAILSRLFSKVHALTLDKSATFSGEFAHDNSKEIRLNDNLYLDFLSPSYTDFTAYKGKCLNYDLLSKKTTYTNNPAANILSTVLQLKYKKETHRDSEWTVLLTSDAEKKILERILDQNSEKRKLEMALSLGQIPHHGSKHNHSKLFWDSFERAAKCPAVVSAGQNEHGHPDVHVISDFNGMEYNAICNNNIDPNQVSTPNAFSDSSIEQVLFFPDEVTNIRSSNPKDSDPAGLKIIIDGEGNAGKPQFLKWFDIRKA